MTITTAHKILIGAAIVFFAFFAVLEVTRFFSTGGMTLLVMGGVSGVAAVGLAFYLRAFIRRSKP
jgi:hypothetical protein